MLKQIEVIIMKHRKIYPSSSWQLPPTVRQCSALTRYGIKDNEMPTTRWDARQLIYDLKRQKDLKQIG